MYLLKKLVGIGNEKATKDVEAEGPEGESRSDSPSNDSVDYSSEKKDPDAVDEKVIEDVKKGHKNKKKKNKSKKTTDDSSKKRIELALEISADDPKKNSDNDTSKHHIPDKYFDDLSETDKSHGGGSTSQDVSSSDISESFAVKTGEEVSEKSGDVDIWAERDEDDFIPRKRLSVDENSPKETVDFDEFWAEFDEEEGKLRRPSQVDAESFSDTDGKNMMTARDETFPSNETEDFWKDESSVREDLNDSEDRSARITGKDEGDEDFWGSDSPEKEVQNHEMRESSLLKDEQVSEDVEGFLEDKSNSKEIESDGKVESFPNQHLKEIDDGVVQEHSESVSDIRNESKSDTDFWGDADGESPYVPEGGDTAIDRGSSENIEDGDTGNEDKKSVTDEFWGDDTSERENEESALEEDVKEFSVKSEEMAMEGTEVEGHDERSDSKSKDLDEGTTSEKNNTSEESSELKEAVIESDDFWGSHAEDSPPSTLTFRKSVDETPLNAQNENFDTIDDTQDTSEQADAADESEKTGSDETASSSQTSTEISDNTPKDEAEPIGMTPSADELDDVRNVHRKSFASALKDIEAPTRRRSLLPLDSRERIIHEERSSRPSESSGEGEVSEDDGIMDFLGKENNRAEARLAARRQARVEAREIRMRELERVQKEQQEEGSDRVFDLHGTPRSSAVSPRERPTPTNSYHSSRRSSEDSVEDGLGLRDIRHELKEVEEKFRKAMIANAQLDNEKAALSYQVELLKDKLEELEEAHSQLGREHKERCREHEALKRAVIKLKEDLNMCKYCLDERDNLIADYGLVIIGGDIDENGELTPRALVSAQSAEILQSAGEGSLDVRLKTLANDKNELVDEVRHLKLELEEEKNRKRNDRTMSNGPIGDELQQTLNDYRFRLQKAEQETNTLQATVARLESQVIRYKSAAEASEKAEDELKVEKRKLQREHRESIARIEELETANSHLQRRMDKLKNAKSTLLKEL